MYMVCIWGSHPDNGNDDCWTGESYRSKAEAIAVYNNPEKEFRNVDLVSSQYIELTQCVEAHNEVKVVERIKIRENPSFKPEKKDNDWRCEIAMQSGMANGCEAYNDMMGY